MRAEQSPVLIVPSLEDGSDRIAELLIASGIRREIPLPYGELPRVLRTFAAGLDGFDALDREAARTAAIAELAHRYGIEAPEARRLVRSALEVAAPLDTGRWTWHTAAELEALPPLAWLVPGRIPAGALVVLYGDRGLGKTFVALDLACSVEAGVAWQGAHVDAGRVGYVLAEGRGGLPQRLAAWRLEHGTSASGVRFLTHAVRLVGDTDVARLVDDLEQLEPSLVVFDTFARCVAPGDENSAQDVGTAVAAFDAIREATGAAVLVLHHTGHDKTRERGSTALGAAADTVLSLRRDGEVLTLSCEKQRDDEPFPATYLRLQPIPEAHSVVVRPLAGAGPVGLQGVDDVVLRALTETHIDGERGVPTGVWLETSGISARHFHRARKRLVDMALVETVKDGRYVLNVPRDSSPAVDGSDDVCQ